MPCADPAHLWSRRQVLRAGGTGVLTALVGVTAACSSGGGSSSGGAVRDATSFGALGDGHRDDTAAINRALAALKPGETLRFGPGKTFCHNQVIKVTTPGVRLIGPGTLLATQEQSSAVQIEAPHVTVEALHLGIRATTQRWSTPSQHKLFLGSHEGITVRNVTVTGSAAAGVFCLGSSSFLLDGVRVFDTRADGIHMTGGAHDGRVRSPRISRSGDDAVAVVSYLDDRQRCRQISITKPRVRTTTGGRGLSVVGGEQISYTDIDVDASSAAAVYVACEGGDSVTYPSEHVRVSRGVITRANSDAGIDHGAVLVYSGRSGGLVDDTVISDLTISGTRPGASRQVGVVVDAQDRVTDVRFTGLRLAADPRPYQGNAPSSAFQLQDVTAAGAHVSRPA